MIRPLQLTFRNVQSSEAVAARIRSESAKLDRYFERITSCRVVVEAPHRHHKWGELFQVRIDLDVPGEKIVVKQGLGQRRALGPTDGGKWLKHLEAGASHKDMYVAIRDAFKVARRRLEDYVRRLRGDVKIHTRLSPIRVAKLRTEESAGV